MLTFQKTHILDYKFVCNLGTHLSANFEILKQFYKIKNMDMNILYLCILYIILYKTLYEALYKALYKFICISI